MKRLILLFLTYTLAITSAFGEIRILNGFASSKNKQTCWGKEFTAPYVKSEFELDGATSLEFKSEVNDRLNKRGSTNTEDLMKKISGKYKNERADQAFGKKVVQTAFGGTKALLHVAGVIGGFTGVGLLVYEGLNYTMGKSMDFALEEMTKEANRSSKALLGKALSEVDESVVAELESYQNEDPDVVYEKAREAVDKMQGTLLSGVKDDDKDSVKQVYHQFMVKNLAGMIAKEGALRKQADEYLYKTMQDGFEKTNARISQNSRNIRGVSAALTEFASKTNETLKGIIDYQNGLTDVVEKIGTQVTVNTGNIAKNTKDISTLKGGVTLLAKFQYSRLSAKEKRVMIESGMLGEVSVEEINKVSAQIHIQNVESYLNGASQLVGIAEQFGFEVGKDLKKGIDLGQKGVNLAMAITSQNPIAALSAVASIFGKRSPDVAAQRHQQIMNQLNNLRLGQTAIMERQEKLFENQLAMFENQKNIIEGLNNLSRQLSDATELLLQEIQKNRGEIYYNREVVQSLVTKDIIKCHDFFARMPGEEEFDRELGRFRTYEDLASYLDSGNYGPQPALNCIDGFNHVLESDLSIGTSLGLESYATKKNGDHIREYVTKIYEPLLKILEGSQRNMLDTYLALTAPSKFIDSIDEKNSKSKDLSKKLDEYDTQEVSHFSGLLERLLSDQKLITFSDYAVKMLPYLGLFDRDGQVIPLDELVETKRTPSRGRRLLENIMRRLDLAIAQQALLSGDVIMPDMFSVITGKTASFEVAHRINGDLKVCTPPYPCETVFETQSVNKLNTDLDSILKALEHNEYLKNNLVKYLVKRVLKEKGKNIISYKMAQSSYNGQEMVKLFDFQNDSVKIVKDKDGWMMNLKGADQRVVSIKLPTMDDLVLGNMDYRPEMNNLLMKKEEIVSELTEFSSQHGLRGEEQEIVNLLYLRMN